MRTLALAVLLGYASALQLKSMDIFFEGDAECFEDPFNGSVICDMNNGCWEQRDEGVNCWGDYKETYSECEGGDTYYYYTDPDGFYEEQSAQYDGWDYVLSTWDWAYYGCSGTWWDYNGQCESYYLEKTDETYSKCWEDDADWGYYEWE